jgi:hypothetical protein
MMKKLFSDRRLIRAACVLCLASLAFTIWAVLDAGPLVVIAAMSIGQGLGMLGVACFMTVVLRDLWARLRSTGAVAPPAAPSDGDDAG